MFKHIRTSPLASDSDESEPSNVENDDEDGIPSVTIAQRFDSVVQVDLWYVTLDITRQTIDFVVLNWQTV